MLEFLVEVQRTIHAALSSNIAAFATDRNWAALLAVLPLGVLFGAAHALTPGHSKAVLATYVAGSSPGTAKALLTALSLALTHITSAVIIAVAAGWLVSRAMTSAGQAPALELARRLLLLGIGCGWCCGPSGGGLTFMAKGSRSASWRGSCPAH